MDVKKLFTGALDGKQKKFFRYTVRFLEGNWTAL